MVVAVVVAVTARGCCMLWLGGWLAVVALGLGGSGMWQRLWLGGCGRGAAAVLAVAASCGCGCI